MKIRISFTKSGQKGRIKEIFTRISGIGQGDSPGHQIIPIIHQALLYILSLEVIVIKDLGQLVEGPKGQACRKKIILKSGL